MKKEKCARPCGTCPFLTRNFGKPNPPGFDELKKSNPKEAKQLRDWYSAANLKRLWKNGISKGEPMMCHSSDPNASEYGGKDAVNSEPKICLGSVIVVFRHLKYMEHLLATDLLTATVQKMYRRKVDFPLTKNGQSSWVWNIAIGAITNNYGMPTSVKLPRTIDTSVIEEISVPWRDEIININQEGE